MKNKTLIQDKRTQEFITQHNADALHFVEVICGTIVLVVALRAVSRCFVALFSRSVFINKPNLQKVVYSGQHLLPAKRE